MNTGVLCPVCKHKSAGVKKRRQNTRYADDSKNYVVSCVKCFAQIEAHWREMWSQI